MGRVHTLNCAAAANRSDLAAGLIRLFLLFVLSRVLSRQAGRPDMLWQRGKTRADGNKA